MSADNTPMLTVVIPTYNRCSDLKKCLDSLMMQTLMDFEVLVIDNGSTDNTGELLNKYPVNVVKDNKKNLAYLSNLGWKLSNTELIVYLNDDSTVPSDWVFNILNTFNEYPTIDVVAGPVIAIGNKQEIATTYNVMYNSKYFRILALIYNNVLCDGKLFSDVATLCDSGIATMGSIFPKSAQLRAPIYIDVFGINNLAMKKELFQTYGGFDETFTFLHFDGDFFIKYRKKGGKILFNSKLKILHFPSPVGPTRIAFHVGRDTARFYLKDIKPTTLSGYIKYILSITFFNLFWLYKFYQTKDKSQLNGIYGFCFGVVEVIKRR